MMKMKAVPGGGYWLDVEGHKFEVVLDTTPRPGVYGGQVANREYFCRIDGKRISGGPYVSANVAKTRLAPLMQRLIDRAQIERDREQYRQMCDRLFPAGVPDIVLAALDSYPEQPVSEEPEPVVPEESEPEDVGEDPETILGPVVADAPADPEADSVPAEADSEPDSEPEPVNLDGKADETPEPEKAEDDTPSQVAAKVRASATPAKRRSRTGTSRKTAATKAKTTDQTDEKVAVAK